MRKERKGKMRIGLKALEIGYVRESKNLLAKREKCRIRGKKAGKRKNKANTLQSRAVVKTIRLED